MMEETILIAEDDLGLSETICETLSREGYHCLAFADPLEALEAAKRVDVDLLVTDLKMPHLDGIELARKVSGIQPDSRIIVITGYSTMNTVIEGLRLGIDSYILKPFRSEEIVFNVKKSMERRRLIRENRNYQAGLESMVVDQTRELVDRYGRLSRSQFESIFAIGNIIEARDTYTRGHTERVTLFSVALAESCGWPEHRIRDLAIGSPLHDIGKIGVPDKILKKKGPLNFKEFELMKLHPEIGYEMVEHSDLPSVAVGCILFHQERYDGKGYPFGLKGEDIPEEGRLMTVCDAFDAMTSDRVYRPAMPVDRAMDIVREYSGTQFDPHMAEQFLKLIEAGAFDPLLYLKEIREEFERLVTRMTEI
ncbi:MAG TPA: HD domain-containing phosphohydrolase [Acidobacteriota bacterium]|nr:HD domain-containing phosphohydrolase [Acidobacteriota bacterium]